MPQTTTYCPRCRQPVVADIEKLFDMNTDPRAKQRLLSGSANFVRCANCGYEGPISTPIVYHDPEKELLLTYFPPEMGLPVNEQERLIGPMITQVTNKLPPEKRKAYLLRPQSMFTYETLIERILEGDGITKDMLQAQQQRLALLQRLLSSTPESRGEIINQEKALIDEDFFALLSRVSEASLAQGDQNTARALAGLQKELLETTDVGKVLQAQAQEAEAAVKSLQEASKNGLTREVLLDLMVEAQSDIRLNTLVSLTRSGMDYTFFQLLSDRIDQASAEEKAILTELREKLLKMTQEIDQAMAEQMNQSRQVLESIVNAANVEEAIAANAQQIDEYFVQSLKDELQKARQAGDLSRSGKLQQVMDTLQKMTAPPPEIAFIDELMSAEDDAALDQMIDANADKISDEMLQLLNGVLNQSEQQGQPPEVIDQLRRVYKAVLRYSMRKNFS